MIIRTNLHDTRELSREIRFQQTATISATNVQTAIEQIDTIAHGAAGGTLRIVTAAGPVTVSALEPGVEINKTVGAATVVNLPPAATRSQMDVVVKDGKGDADVNNITVVPDAGDVGGIDGNATDVLNISKQAQRYRPKAGGWIRI